MENKNVMIGYNLWCDAFNGGKGKKDPKTFKHYLRETKVNVKNLNDLLSEYFGLEPQEFDNIDISHEKMISFDSGEISRREKQIQRESSATYRKQLDDGEFIYANFVEWVRRYCNNKGKHDPEKFKEYMKEENVVLTDRQKLHLATKYFGYKKEK